MKTRTSDSDVKSKRGRRPRRGSANGGKVRTPRQKRSITTKKQIIEAAMRLFSEKGYHHTNTKEITAAAGVATGSFYAYFTDKREVFIAVLDSYQVRFNALVNHYLEQTVAAAVDSRGMITGLIKVLLEAHQFLTGFHNELVIMRIEDPEVDNLMKAEEKRDIAITRDRISQWPRELKASDLDAAAFVVYSTIHHMVDLISLTQTDIPAESLIEQTADMVAKYLYE